MELVLLAQQHRNTIIDSQREVGDVPASRFLVVASQLKIIQKLEENNMYLSQKSLKKLRKILLEITPEITAVLDEFGNINKLRMNTDEDGDTDGKGIEVIKEIIDMLLIRQYDRIVKIIASLYEIKPNTLEEKTVTEITDMIFDTLSDETLMRFFPQLRLLTRKTPSAI